MAHEPKKKHSKSAKRIRRASKALSSTALLTCKNCGQKTLAHMVCRNCGFYAGKKIGEQQVKITRA